jgi:hypothetical protein
MIPGIDISKWQQGSKGIDWRSVAAYLLGLDPEAFAIVELCDGLDPSTVNPYLYQQVGGAEAEGIRNLIFYMLLRPSQGTGAQHADLALKIIGDVLGGIKKNQSVSGDFEDDQVPATADLDAFALDFDGRVARPLGFHSIFYSGPWYTVAHNLNRDPKLTDMGLWWADPNAGTASLKQPLLYVPAVPEPWKTAGKKILAVQSNWHGSVPGIEGDVDLDWLFGGIETLRPFQYGYQSDPVAGISATGVPDLDSASDVPTTIKHVIGKLEGSPPDVPTAIADLSQCLTHNFGLLGS